MGLQPLFLRNNFFLINRALSLLGALASCKNVEKLRGISESFKDGLTTNGKGDLVGLEQGSNLYS